MIPFRRRPLSLGSRIGLASIAILLAVQAVGLLAYRSDVEERREAELRNTVALGRGVAAVVDGFGQDIERVTFATALLLGGQDAPLDQAGAGGYLRALLAEYPVLRALFLTDPAGRVIASDTGTGVGADISARPYIGVLQRGAQTTWSGSLTGLESGEVTIAFGRPVRRPDGTVRAFLVAAFHAARLAEGLPVALPPDADVSILDESAQLLYSSTQPLLPTTRRSAAADPGVAQALAGSLTPVRDATGHLPGGPRYGVFVPVERMRWVVGVTRPHLPLEEALAARFLRQAGAVAAIMLLAGAFQAFLARRLTWPIRQLAAAAGAVARGERPVLPGPEAVNPGSEVGQLAGAMRLMDEAVAEREARLRAESAQLQRAATENERLYREAREAVRLRDDFLSIAAHELKTPLTSLQGMAQLSLRRLGRGGEVNREQVERAFTSIDSQARRLGQLVSRLLDVSRITTGRLVLEPAEVDLAELVRDAVGAARARTERHELLLDAPESLPARVDPMRLEQVLVNLLDNAIKYSPDGGTIEVALRADDRRWTTDDRLASTDPQRSSVVGGRSSGDGPGEWALISVRDHGTGIPPESRERIFDRFYQAHGHGHLSGLGLGLFISREIVELHGGTIRAEFPEDGGTRMIVTLPVGTPTAAPPAPVPAAAVTP